MLSPTPTPTNFDPVSSGFSASRADFALPNAKLAVSHSSRGLRQPLGTSFTATEDVTNVRLLISFFKTKLAAAPGGSEDEGGGAVERVQQVILDNLGSLELLESTRSGEGSEEQYSERDHLGFFARLMEVVYADCLELIN